MAAPDEFAADPAGFFAGLSQVLVSDHEILATLDRICHNALSVVPTSSFCGITVRRRRGRLESLAYTDDVALACDELQYELQEGPCISTAAEGEPFLVRSTAHDARWPRWGPRVAEWGVHSLVSAQLSAATLDTDRDPLGAVNVYGRAPDAFDTEDMERLRLYGIHAGNALAMAHMVTTLQEAVEARHEIGLAQGILMSRYALDRDAAFESMRRCSSHTNMKLRELAGLVIANGELPEPSKRGIPAPEAPS